MPKRKRRYNETKLDPECDQSSLNSSSDETDASSANQKRLTRRSSVSSSLIKQETVNSSSKNDNQDNIELSDEKQNTNSRLNQFSKKSKNKLNGNESFKESENSNTRKSMSRMRTRGKHEIPSDLSIKEKKLSQADSADTNQSNEKTLSKKNHGTPKRSNPLGMSDHELVLALDESGGRLRKRKFNHSYQVDMKQCPVPGCDSRGHLMGKFERHFTPAACPIYHNLTPERCRENHEAYQRLKQDQLQEAKELEKQQAHHNTRKQADSGPTPNQLKYVIIKSNLCISFL